MAPETPLDIKMGLTSAEDVSHPLRWGFMTAGRICKDMALAVKIAASRGCGGTLGAVAARKLEDAEAFAKEIGCARFYGGDDACKCSSLFASCWDKKLTKRIRCTDAQICADPEIDICCAAQRHDFPLRSVPCSSEDSLLLSALCRRRHDHVAARGARSDGAARRQARVSDHLTRH